MRRFRAPEEQHVYSPVTPQPDSSSSGAACQPYRGFKINGTILSYRHDAPKGALIPSQTRATHLSPLRSSGVLLAHRAINVSRLRRWHLTRLRSRCTRCGRPLLQRSTMSIATVSPNDPASAPAKRHATPTGVPKSMGRSAAIHIASLRDLGVSVETAALKADLARAWPPLTPVLSCSGGATCL